MTLQVLRYFDYVFTGVFTFEMIIKVSYYEKMSEEMLLNHVNVSNGFKFKDILWFSNRQNKHRKTVSYENISDYQRS